MKFTYDTNRGEYQKAFEANRKQIEKAATAAIDDAKDEVIKQGRAAIASGGLGPKWQNALRVERYPKRGVSMDAAAWIFHRIKYADVFQSGATIAGKPLLWLPLNKTPSRVGGMKLTARNYALKIGPLHTIRVPGKPPLLAAFMEARAGGKAPRKITLSGLQKGAALSRLGVGRSKSARGKKLISVPLFFGISSVQLRKRFDLTAIIQRASNNIGNNYLRHINSESER